MAEYVIYECHHDRVDWRVRLQEDGVLEIKRGASAPKTFDVAPDVARGVVSRFPRRSLEIGYSVAQSPITLGWGEGAREPATISPWPDEPAYYQFLEEITGVVNSKTSTDLMPSMAPPVREEDASSHKEEDGWRDGLDLKLGLLGLFVMWGLPFGVGLVTSISVVLLSVLGGLILPTLGLAAMVLGGLFCVVLGFASYYWAGLVIGQLAARMSRDAVLHATLCAVVAIVLGMIPGFFSSSSVLEIAGTQAIVIGTAVWAVFGAIVIYLVRHGSREGVRRSMIPYF